MEAAAEAAIAVGVVKRPVAAAMPAAVVAADMLLMQHAAAAVDMR